MECDGGPTDPETDPAAPVNLEEHASPEDESQPPPNPWDPPPPPPPNFGFEDPSQMENLNRFDEGPPVPHFASFHQDLNAFPGDYYAATDMDITRGLDPVCVMKDGDVGVPPPFMADYHGLGAGFLQDLGVRDPGAGSGFDKKFDQGGVNYPGGIQDPLQQQLAPPDATPVPFFQRGTTPPNPPASPHFSMRSTSIYAKAEGFEVGNILLAFLRRDYIIFDLKVKQQKFTIKTDVIVGGGGSVFTIKIRIYQLPNKTVCCEFQRQHGDPFEFGALYRKAATLLEVQKFSAGRSLESIQSGNRAEDNEAQRAIDAAQAQMNVSALPPVAMDIQNSLEPLLHQAASVHPNSRAEAAKALAGLANEADKDGATELLQRLVKPNEETGEAPLLTLLGTTGYPEACLIQALFKEPSCTEMLWKSPQGIEAWQGILSPFTAKEAPTASLTKLSQAVRDICAALVAYCDLEEKTAQQLREQLRCCLEEAGHRSSVVRSNLEEAMMQVGSEQTQFAF